MQRNNIFADLREKIALIKDNRKRRNLTPEQRDRMNEAKAWLVLMLFTAFMALFVGYMSLKYYLMMFDNSFPGASVWLSLGASILHEVVKITLTYSALSSLFFGWMFRRWSNFFGNVVALTISFGVYYWSYQVSTEGLAIYAEQTGNQIAIDSRPEFSVFLATYTADVDMQLNALSGSDQAATNMTNKKGQIVWTGQTTISDNAEARKALNAQRSTLVEQAKADYAKLVERAERKNITLAEWVNRFGGYGEFGLLLCIIGLIFFDRNSNEEPEETATAPAQTPPTPSPTNGNRPQHLNGSYVTYSPWMPPNGGNNTPYNNRVTQSDTAVTPLSDPDPQERSRESYLHFRTKFLRDVANLKNGNGYRHSVSGRLGVAMSGIINNIAFATDDDIDTLKLDYTHFQDVHNKIAGTYTIPFEQTPLYAYWAQAQHLGNYLQSYTRQVPVKVA